MSKNQQSQKFELLPSRFAVGWLLVCATVAGSIYFLPKPFHMYTAPTVDYGVIAYLDMEQSHEMVGIAREDVEKKYAIDFSEILTLPDVETTLNMKYVANTCLPSHQFKSLVLPNVAYKTFRYATTYLICAMETRKQRFCQSDERKRLIGQLMKYRILHQHIVGWERARLGTNAGVMDKELLINQRQMDETLDRAPKAPRPNPNISLDLDARITERLAVLNQEGYISPMDFGWWGWILPVEYAPFLINERNNIGKCR